MELTPTKLSGRGPYGLVTGTRAYALCADGIVRRVTVTAEPDTWFSVPARVTYRANGERWTVTGYVGTASSDARPELGEHERTLRFHAYRYGANGDRIPSRTCPAPRRFGDGPCGSLVWSADPDARCYLHRDHETNRETTNHAHAGA